MYSNIPKTILWSGKVVKDTNKAKCRVGKDAK
jgi:hypothetical protein